jgi:hypothetical protein
MSSRTGTRCGREGGFQRYGEGATGAPQLPWLGMTTSGPPRGAGPWRTAAPSSKASMMVAAATAVRTRRHLRSLHRDGALGRSPGPIDVSPRPWHAQRAAERGPALAGNRRRLGGLERQRAAQLWSMTAGSVAGCGRRRRSGRVSWAVYSQAKTEKPVAVRIARGTFWTSERSLSSIRSPRLAPPTPTPQVAAYRHGRSTASCAHRSTRTSSRSGWRTRWGSGRGCRAPRMVTGIPPARGRRSRQRGS